MKTYLRAAAWLSAGIFLVSLTAQAADIIKPDSQSPNVTVGINETHKNLYTAGGNVAIGGNTAGDLVVAGAQVSLEGNVEQELLAAGGTLNLNGSVGGHARIAGGNITLNGPIGGDLVMAGGNIDVTEKSSVGGDVMIAGGDIIFGAPVKGLVRMAGGNITINSKINGDVYAQASQNLTFGPQAEILGKVYYTGPKAADIQSGAKVPNIEFNQQAFGGYRHELVALLSIALLIKLLAWFIFGFLIVKFRKAYATSLYESVKLHPWQSLGWGLVSIIVMPILAILLLVTFVGYYLAAVLGVVYALMLLLCGVLSAVTLGYLILGRLTKPNDGINDWQAVLIGVVIWSLLRFVPFLGFLAMAVLFLMVFGAMMKVLRQSFK